MTDTIRVEFTRAEYLALTDWLERYAPVKHGGAGGGFRTLGEHDLDAAMDKLKAAQRLTLTGA